MSTIHYFQRYSQRENVATNNTLLLFSRLYHYSPLLFSKFLTTLLDDYNVEPGISFSQQSKSPKSVPDGIISQSSFQIIIETKLSDLFSKGQLEQHISSFSDEKFKVLLLLGSGVPSKDFRNSLTATIEASQHKDIRHIALTFKDVIETFREIIPEYETELQDIINDFEDYCREENLIDVGDSWLRVMACGWSLKENREFGIYYDPVDRGYSRHKYLGFYANKSVRGIGIIENIITATLNPDGSLDTKGTSDVTDFQKQRIKGVIAAAMANNKWNISHGHKFFCVKQFCETDFRKVSKGPLLRSKYFDLLKVLGVKELPDVQKIAEMLKNKEWN